MKDSIGSKAHTFEMNNRVFYFDPSTRCSWIEGGYQLGPLEQQIKVHKASGVSYLMLHLTNACNINCAYCYESRGASETMPLTIAKEAIDDILGRQSTKHLSVHFFGGEPLLCSDLITDVVDYCESLDASCDYHISTNGLLLQDDMILFLKKHNFRILISWDGSSYESCRKWPDGSNTTADVFESIRQTADAFAEQENNVQIRITVTRLTRSLQDTVNTLLQAGVSRFVLKDAADDKLGFQSQHREYAIRLYDELATYYSHLIMNAQPFYLYGRATGFTTVLKDINRPNPRKGGCGCGVSRLTVLPGGEYVPCSRYDGEHMKLGCIQSGLSKNYENLCKMLRAPDACEQCYARFVCGGVCHGASRRHQTWMPPDGEECILTRYRVIRAVALRHQLHEAGISDNLLTGVRQ